MLMLNQCICPASLWPDVNIDRRYLREASAPPITCSVVEDKSTKSATALSDSDLTNCSCISSALTMPDVSQKLPVKVAPQLKQLPEYPFMCRKSQNASYNYNARSRSAEIMREVSVQCQADPSCYWERCFQASDKTYPASVGVYRDGLVWAGL